MLGKIIRPFLLVVVCLYALTAFNLAPARTAHAGTSPPQWAEDIGEPQQNEAATAAVYTTAGGLVVTGQRADGGWLFHLDDDGTLDWQETYPSLNLGPILAASDGGYLIAGATLENPSQLALLKVNNLGEPQWSSRQSSDTTLSLSPTALGTFPDGDYLAIGSATVFEDHHTRSQGWLLKFDAQGNRKWFKLLDGYRNSLTGLVRTSDGFVLVGATRYAANHPEAWVVKINFQGKLLWQKTFGTRASESAYAIVRSGDGGYLVAASGFLLKLNASGNLVWQKSYDVRTTHVLRTTDDGFILIGERISNSGESDVLIFKIDAQGTPLWKRRYDGGRVDSPRSLISVPSGFAIVGSTRPIGPGIRTDAFVFRLDLIASLGPNCTITKNFRLTATPRTAPTAPSTATVTNHNPAPYTFVTQTTTTPSTLPTTDRCSTQATK